MRNTGSGKNGKMRRILALLLAATMTLQQTGLTFASETEAPTQVNTEAAEAEARAKAEEEAKAKAEAEAKAKAEAEAKAKAEAEAKAKAEAEAEAKAKAEAEAKAKAEEEAKAAAEAATAPTPETAAPQPAAPETAAGQESEAAPAETGAPADAETEETSETNQVETDDAQNADSETAGTEVSSESETEEKESETEEVFQSGTLRYAGNGYQITVSYDKEAEIPAGAKIASREVPQGSAEYESLLARTHRKMGITDVVEKATTQARFFDISILDKNGKTIEPASGVTVEITYSKAVEVEDANDIDLIHFAGTGTELLDVEATAVNGSGDVKKIEFDSESFSLFGFVYTVDYTYDGYTYHMPGDGQMTLSELFSALKINASAAEAVDVSFTDTTLLKIERQGNDYLLTSLKPFTTHETLTVTMKDGVQYVIQVEDEVSTTNLTNVLTGVTISGIEPDKDGVYHVKMGKEYSFHISFQENKEFQFADEMEMDLPAGLVVSDQTGPFSITITNSNGTFDVKGAYTITDGKLKVKIDDTDPHYADYASVGNAEISFEYRASVSEEAKKLIWKTGVETQVDVDTSNSVSVTKTASYSAEDGKAHYNLKVVSTGTSTNIVVKDTISGSALTLDTDSITGRREGDAWDSTYGKVQGTPTTKGFEYKIDSLGDGEVVNISYTASINYGAITGTGTAEQTGNSVTVKSDGGEDGDTADLENKIQYTGIKKSDGVVSGDGDIKTVTWTVTYNDKPIKSVSGRKITDTITSNNMIYSGNGIHVDVYKADGTKVTSESKDIAWSSLTGKTDTTWTYTVPESHTEAYKYVITYTTQVDMTNLVEDVNVSNGVGDDIGNSDTGNGVVGVGEGNTLGVKKEAPSVTSEEIQWKVTLTVPDKGLNTAVVKDTYPKTSFNGADGKYYENVIEALKEGTGVTVTGLLDGESYTLDKSDSEFFTLTFYKNADKTQTGLKPRAGTENKTIVLTFTTTNNAAWVAAELPHTNHVRFTGNDLYYKEDDRTVTPTGTVTVTKTLASSSNKVTIDGVEKTAYEYWVAVSGYDGTKDLVIEETFNPDYLMYVDGNTPNATGWALGGEALSGFVHGSLEATWDSSPTYNAKMNYETTATGGRFTLARDNVPGHGASLGEGGSVCKYYRLHYFMVLKDTDKIDTVAHSSNDKLTINNTATFEEVSDSASFTYDVTNLTKTGTVVNNSKVDYVIDVNPHGFDLSSGDSLTATDTHSANLSVDYTTITVKNSKTNADVAFQYAPDGNTITFTIPDATPVTIRYSGYINQKGEAVTVTNNVEVAGYSDDSTQTANVTSTGKGSGSNPFITILKHETGDASKGLANAVFQLFEDLNGSWVPVKDKKGENEGEDVTFTTGANGTVNVEGNQGTRGWVLYADKKYALLEITAPEGYELDDTYYEFTISDEADYKAPNWKYLNGDVLTVKNSKKTSIQVTKVWKDADGKTIDAPEGSVVLKLYANGKATDQTVTLDGTVDTATDAASGEFTAWVATFGDLAFKDDAGEEITYTVKEESGPADYTVSYGKNEKGQDLTEASDRGTITNTHSQPDKPTFEKKIQDTNDTTGTTSGWQDSADYDIGDAVPYRLTATLPKDVTDYYTYHITFHDTLETGKLKYNRDASVQLNGKSLDTTKCTLQIKNVTDNAFDVFIEWGDGKNKISDKALNGATVDVFFTAELLNGANIGQQGNINTAYLEYSNNPSLKNGGTPDKEDETGKTDKDTVIAFTYKAEISKVDAETKKALTGAEFKLEKKLKNGQYEEVDRVSVTDESVFTFTGLDDGIYRLTETAVPKGYKSIDPMEFTVTAEHTTEWDSKTGEGRAEVLTKLSGEAAAGVVALTNLEGAVADGKISGDVENKPAEQPSFEKKIQDINDSTGETSGWQDSADYDIGDTIPYQLTATLANNVTDYYKYFITFEDEMEESLTFQKITKVTVDGKELGSSEYKLDEKTDHSFKLTLTWTGADGGKIKENLNSKKVIVEFEAKLNENAKLGAEGNVNKAKLVYSNNSNLKADATPKDDDKKETPYDAVIAFTYQTVINKVDANKASLAGAEFTLEKISSGETPEVVKTYEAAINESGYGFTFTGLDDGIYRLTETVVPKGYKAIEPIVFTVSAAHDDEWDSEGQQGRTAVLKTLTGEVTTGKVALPALTGDAKSGTLTGSVINQKAKEPKFEKKIKYTNDSTRETTDWQDSADYDIGDSIPYQLKATLADNVTDYYKYFITFEDEMEESLTFQGITKVTVDGKELASSEYKLDEQTDHSFKLTLSWTGADGGKIKENLNSKQVIVEFEAKLNEDAKLGAEGNVNKAKLVYSNNSNLKADQTPGKDDKKETPEDSVIAFTYKVEIDKTNTAGDALDGAQFKLEKVAKDGTRTEVQLDASASSAAKFVFKGLDDGDYILTETKAPDGYKQIDPITFTVTAGHDTIWTNQDRESVLTSLSGDVTTGELTLASDKTAGSLSGSISNTETLVRIAKVDANDNTKLLAGAQMEVLDASGKAVRTWTSTTTPYEITGLLTGETYTLRETVAPNGYKVTADSTFTMDAKGVVAASAKQAADGTILVQDEVAAGKGSVQVTKYTLKNDGAFKVADQTYYTALFSDSALTARVTDVKPLVLKEAYTTTDTFENLDYGTYYVAETDALGNPVTAAPNISKVEITGGTQTLSEANKSGEAIIRNTIPEGVLGEYVPVNLKVKKRVLDASGNALNVNETFYFRLFYDEALTEPVTRTGIQSVKLSGQSSGTATFKELPYADAFYVAEVDKDGKPVSSDKSFAYKVSYKNNNGLTYAQADGASVTVTNAFKSGRVAGENKNKEAVKTGDTTPILPLLASMFSAALAALYLGLRRRRERA